jgi:hypothetical protein
MAPQKTAYTLFVENEAYSAMTLMMNITHPPSSNSANFYLQVMLIQFRCRDKTSHEGLVKMKCAAKLMIQPAPAHEL